MKKIPFSIAKTPPMTHTAARILTAATILVRVLRNHHNNDNGSQRSGLSATCTRDTLSSTTAGSSQGQASWSPGYVSSTARHARTGPAIQPAVHQRPV